MNKTSEGTKGFDPVSSLREARDAWVDAWSKAALRLTGSHGWQWLNGALAQPALNNSAKVAIRTSANEYRFISTTLLLPKARHYFNDNKSHD